MRWSWASAAVALAATGLLLSGCGARVDLGLDLPPYEEPPRSGRSPMHHLVNPSLVNPSLVNPSLVDPVPVDPGSEVPDRAAPRTAAGWQVGSDGILARIVLTEAPGVQRMVSFTASGRVVSAADRSVFMGRDDLTTWRLSPARLATTLRALDAVGVRTAEPGSFGEEPGAASASVFYEPGRVASGTDPGLVETVRAIVEPPEQGVRPWAPYAIGFLAGPPDRTGRSPLDADAPFRPWPLRRAVVDLAFGTMPDAYGVRRHALCLRGRQAARVWRRLFTGENTAYLRVDDGRRWELNASVVLPGYVLLGSPCDGATVGE